MNLLQGDPLVIVLDELPPYFVNAASKSIGNSDLSVVTATALANLLVAVGRDELRNVCLVMSDLTASYAAGSERVAGALRLGVHAQADSRWVELNFSDDVELPGDGIEQQVERIRELLPGGEVDVTAGYVRFATGQRFLDWIADSRESYVRDEVEP